MLGGRPVALSRIVGARTVKSVGRAPVGASSLESLLTRSPSGAVSFSAARALSIKPWIWDLESVGPKRVRVPPRRARPRPH